MNNKLMIDPKRLRINRMVLMADADRNACAVYSCDAITLDIQDLETSEVRCVTINNAALDQRELAQLLTETINEDAYYISHFFARSDILRQLIVISLLCRCDNAEYFKIAEDIWIDSCFYRFCWRLLGGFSDLSEHSYVQQLCNILQSIASARNESFLKLILSDIVAASFDADADNADRLQFALRRWFLMIARACVGEGWTTGLKICFEDVGERFYAFESTSLIQQLYQTVDVYRDSQIERYEVYDVINRAFSGKTGEVVAITCDLIAQTGEYIESLDDEKVEVYDFISRLLDSCKVGDLKRARLLSKLCCYPGLNREWFRKVIKENSLNIHAFQNEALRRAIEYGSYVAADTLVGLGANISVALSKVNKADLSFSGARVTLDRLHRYQKLHDILRGKKDLPEKSYNDYYQVDGCFRAAELLGTFEAVDASRRAAKANENRMQRRV